MVTSSLQAFLTTILNPLNRGRAASTLKRPMAIDGANILPRYRHAERFIAEGAEVDVEKGTITFRDGTYLTRRDVTDAVVIYAEWLAAQQGKGATT